MSEQEIIEGNKLIADYMGEAIDVLGKFGQNWKKVIGDISPIPSYHESWDWLMPVVSKIESDGYDFFMQPLECTIIDSEGYEVAIDTHMGISTNIEGIWNCVIKFIKWHNALKED
jgi:hypothetical protein